MVDRPHRLLLTRTRNVDITLQALTAMKPNINSNNLLILLLIFQINRHHLIHFPDLWLRILIRDLEVFSTLFQSEKEFGFDFLLLFFKVFFEILIFYL